MYSTTAYLYQQIQEVLMIDISGIGTTFDRRWQPVYAKNLKLNLGVDNVILFQFQNQDQKPVNISGSTFTFRMISQDGEDLLYATELVALNAATGRAKVTIPAADTLNFIAQPASWSLEVSSGVLDQAVFTDDYSGARGSIDIVDSVFPRFVASQVLTIPDQDPAGNLYYTSTVATNGTKLTTFQIDTQGYTGNLTVQGATDSFMNTVQWYDIDFEDLNTGNTVSQLDFSNSSTRLAINVEGFHPFVRLGIQKQAGNIDLITYR
jgi:hypothetical protein